MKLRNIKTGEVVELECITIFDRPGRNDIGDDISEFTTLAELNEEWEDYKEPLIKDEKIRKAVKVWAEANYVKCARIVGVGTLRCERTGVDIEFDGAPFVGWVTGLKTIDELCGEEE